MNGGRPIFDVLPRALIAAVLTVLFLALAISARAGRRGGRSKDAFDPLGFPSDDSVVTAHVGEPVRDTARSPRTEPSHPTATAVPAAAFQVQFFATTDQAEAEDMRQRAEAALPDSVSLEFETPYYKLRAGRFSTRDAAESLLVKFRAMGYESAWILPLRPPSQPKSPGQ